MNQFAKLFLIALSICAIFAGGVIYERNYGPGGSAESTDVADFLIPPPNLQNTDVHVFLLAGQSNMDGRGALTDYSPPPKHLSNRIFVFGRDYTLSVGREPVSVGGPSIVFAATYLQQTNDPGVSVVLVPAAKGATSIMDWMPTSVDGALYTEAVKRTLVASHLGEIRGILFFQGKSDALAGAEDNSNSWGRLFVQIITEFRADLNTPELPIVFAQLGAGGDAKWKKIKATQKGVELDNSMMITIDDLPYGKDVHFTTSSYIEIGRRFGMAMADLQ